MNACRIVAAEVRYIGVCCLWCIVCEITCIVNGCELLASYAHVVSSIIRSIFITMMYWSVTLGFYLINNRKCNS